MQQSIHVERHFRSSNAIRDIVTLFALALFGFVKGVITGITRLRSAIQTLLIGGAAAAACILAKYIS